MKRIMVAVVSGLLAGMTLPDTFDATVVDFAAVTELPVTPTNNPATINTPARKPALDRMSEHYNTLQ